VATSAISIAYFFYPQKLYGFLFDLSDEALTPLLRKMDPEVSHRLSVAFSRSMFRLKVLLLRLLLFFLMFLSSQDLDPDDPSLSTTVMGLKFSNPLGLAAGFDKHGDAIGGGLDLGFAFVEVGSVTPKEQPGNPYPRVFRLPEDRAVINRYGFNSHGVDRVASNLIEFQNYRESYRHGLVGINAGKNKETTEEEAHNDYTSVIERSPSPPPPTASPPVL
jgi:dihydroorotate dehydrogenase